MKKLFSAILALCLLISAAAFCETNAQFIKGPGFDVAILSAQSEYVLETVLFQKLLPDGRLVLLTRPADNLHHDRLSDKPDVYAEYMGGACEFWNMGAYAICRFTDNTTGADIPGNELPMELQFFSVPVAAEEYRAQYGDTLFDGWYTYTYSNETKAYMPDDQTANPIYVCYAPEYKIRVQQYTTDMGKQCLCILTAVEYAALREHDSITFKTLTEDGGTLSVSYRIGIEGYEK